MRDLVSGYAYVRVCMRMCPPHLDIQNLQSRPGSQVSLIHGGQSWRGGSHFMVMENREGSAAGPL